MGLDSNRNAFFNEIVFVLVILVGFTILGIKWQKLKEMTQRIMSLTISTFFNESKDYNSSI